MSVEAITWANKQRVGSSGAKLVLLALANYADDEAYAWPSYRTLADVTEMSSDSISRHVLALEARGLLAREERFDDNGRRKSNRIRLLLAAGGTPANCGVPTPAKTGGTPPQIQGVGTPQKQGDLNPQIEPKDEPSPQTPEGAGVGSSISDLGEEGEAEAPDTQFDVFWTLYAPHALASRAKALSRWSRLSPVDRAQALAQLPKFLDLVRASGRKSCDPSTYLAERRWEGLASVPAPAPKATEPAKAPGESDPIRNAVLWATSGTADRSSWVFVEEGTAAWQDWHAAFVAAGFGHRFTRGVRTMVRGLDGQWGRPMGRTFPMARPPGAGADPPAAASPEDVERYL